MMDETLLANGPADLFAHIDDAGFEEPDGGCALKVVSPLENIVEDLKPLPPARLEVAADFVHRLKRISDEERQAILSRTAGALSPEEADELERVIEEESHTATYVPWVVLGELHYVVLRAQRREAQLALSAISCKPPSFCCPTEHE